MKNLQQELENIILSGKLAIFEIEVINIKTSEQDWILCDIDINETHVFCQRIAVSTKEENSNLIAVSEIEIDKDFSLDSHLQELLSEVIENICNGDLFDLAD